MKCSGLFAAVLVGGVFGKNVAHAPYLHRRGELSTDEFIDQLMYQGPAVPAQPLVMLDTALAQHREVSVFSGYVRDLVGLYLALGDLKQSILVVAPLDSAVEALGAKPWEFPTKIDGSLSAEEADKAVALNVQSFVELHIAVGWNEAVHELDSSTHTVEVATVNGNRIRLRNHAYGFQVAAAATRHRYVDAQVFPVANGAILVIPDCLSKP